MEQGMNHCQGIIRGVAAFCLIGVGLGAQASPIAVATYLFNGNLNAEEAGVAALTAIDPLGANHFRTETVFGTPKTVYRFDGNTTPSQQAGLVLDTTGLLDGDDNYSVDITFRFDVNSSSWENIFGVSNRTSDNAFYVSPTGPLQVYPSSLGPDAVTQNEWHRVTLTNSGSQVKGYLDGVFQFDLPSTVMNFSTYSVNNPNRLIHFFADNLVGGGQGEFADGSVSLIRLYDITLDANEVADLPASVPGPANPLLFLVGLTVLLGSRLRHG
ncbi:MAG: LamG-like jellyroll fold domain-containing protein [Pseudomonadota bacterium]